MSEYIHEIRPGLDDFLEKRVRDAQNHTEEDLKVLT